MRTLTTAGLIAGLAMTTAGWARAQETKAPETQNPDTQGQDAPAGAAPAADYDASTVLATVNGTEITLGHAIVMRQRLPPQYASLSDEALLPGILEQLVDQTLLADSVSGAAAEDPLAVQLHLENERRGTLAARAVQQSVADQVDDAKLQAAYEAATADFQPQTEYSAAHILVDGEEKAKALLAEIEGGADFAEVAAANSTDGSAQAGGALGWFGAGQMVPEFEAAVKDMEVGAVAGPVQTQFGWHLIKLTDKRQSAPPSLEELRPALESQIQQDALRVKLEELRANAKIDMATTMPPASAISDTAVLGE